MANRRPFKKKVSVIDKNNNGKPEKTTNEWYLNGVLVRREVQHDKDEDGLPDAGYTELWQGGKPVFVEILGPRPFKDRQRIFLRDGKIILIELDRDDDGVFEWIMVFNDDEEPCTVFKCADRENIELLGTNSVQSAKEGVRLAKKFFQVITNQASCTNAARDPRQ